jgi:phage terminase small subunit
MSRKAMSPKQQMACNFYLQGMSMRQAMIKAGFSPVYADHNAAQFLKHRGMIEYIRARQKDVADTQLADAIFVRKKLIELTNDPDSRVRLQAVKQLDEHNKWMQELEVKLKQLEDGLNGSKELKIKKIIIEGFDE